MAASDHLGGQWPSDVSRAMEDGGQLVMFAPARDLKAAVTPLKWDYRNVVDEGTGEPRRETTDELWDRKEREADGYLTPRIKKDGVLRPVRLTESGTVVDGHHRIAAASKHDQWVPLEWNRELDAL